jgi:hypothetical protein
LFVCLFVLLFVPPFPLFVLSLFLICFTFLFVQFVCVSLFYRR